MLVAVARSVSTV